MSAGPSRSTTPAAGPSTSRPLKPPVVQPRRAPGGTSQSIVVNPCQRGNPVLDAIKNVPWEYGQIVPDYVVGATTGVLFLSLRYHRLHPEYVHQRIGKLEGRYGLRVLLMMCDVSEHEEPIRELTKVCLINNLTIMVAWSAEEAGLYLSTYKLFEHKPPDRIKERIDKDYTSLLRAALTSIRGVNKTDVTTLSTNVGSVREMSGASVERLLECPGFGEVKSRRVVEAFQRPFRNVPAGGRGNPFAPAQGKGTTADEAPGEEEEVVPTEREKSGRQEAPRKPREPSPEWGELDLDLIPPEEEEEEAAPPSAQPRKPDLPLRALGGSDTLDRDDEFESSDEEAPPAKRSRTNGARDETLGQRPARESPEWDIGLDLN